jgi:type I site-specific restriction endonuclease
VPYSTYTEQDTADKLILPYLSEQFGFPVPSSLDYQVQHTTHMDDNHTGRYDGLYLSGGFPYTLLEAKRYEHDLTDADTAQARAYATGPDFDRPVPFLVISNGREHKFFKRTETIDPVDGRLRYNPIPATKWNAITEEAPGEVRKLLSEQELLSILLDCKGKTFRDVSALFTDSVTARYDYLKHPSLGKYLKQIVEERKKFGYCRQKFDHNLGILFAVIEQ